MNEKDFVKICKKQVVNYTNEHLDKTDNKVITEDDVFVVWLCKALQNNFCFQRKIIYFCYESPVMIVLSHSNKPLFGSYT